MCLLPEPNTLAKNLQTREGTYLVMGSWALGPPEEGNRVKQRKVGSETSHTTKYGSGSHGLLSSVLVLHTQEIHNRMHMM